MRREWKIEKWSFRLIVLGLSLIVFSVASDKFNDGSEKDKWLRKCTLIKTVAVCARESKTLFKGK